MKLHGRGDWTRERRAQVACRLAEEILLEQSIKRIRMYAELIRSVLARDGPYLDMLVEKYPILAQ